MQTKKAQAMKRLIAKTLGAIPTHNKKMMTLVSATRHHLLTQAHSLKKNSSFLLQKPSGNTRNVSCLKCKINSHCLPEAFADDECTCKIGSNIDQAKQLTESSFDYVTNIDEHKLFRKRE